jgi:nicotinate-nucleotide adenylyltransferase
MKPLAIFGGTFDPIHIGHLSVAWEAAELLDAEVRLMPASVPPHRSSPTASAEQRVEMLRAALRGQSRLMLDTRELDRSGPSYTIDTLHELRREFGDRPLVLLLGADAFAGLRSWHRWRELFDVTHIGMLNRPGGARRCFAPHRRSRSDSLATSRPCDRAGGDTAGGFSYTHPRPAGRRARSALSAASGSV